MDGGEGSVSVGEAGDRSGGREGGRARPALRDLAIDGDGAASFEDVDVLCRSVGPALGDRGALTIVSAAMKGSSPRASTTSLAIPAGDVAVGAVRMSVSVG